MSQRKLTGIFLLVLFLVVTGIMFGIHVDEDPLVGEEMLLETEAVAAKTMADETAPKDTDSSIFVHVCGQVNAPDVYEMACGSRVYEAIDYAGGMTDTADTSALNLAMVLSDGQKLYVPAVGESHEDEPEASSNGLVNINKASLQELMTLPGIGESKAKAVIAYRESHGAFESPGDLISVPGIGDGIYSRIASLIKID